MLTTTKISKSVISEITRALKSIKGYGSLEVYVQDHVVTQITVRNIKKTSVGLHGEAQTKTTKVIK